MSIPYRLIDLFIRVPPNADGSKTIDITNYDSGGVEYKFWVNAYATFVVIDFIASMMSMVEFHTYRRGEIFKGYEWQRLNVKPNLNQNSPDFKREYYSKLLYYGEVLVVPYNDQLIIADDFIHHPEIGIGEDYFEQVSRGNFTFNYKHFQRSEVFYQKFSAMDVTGIQQVLSYYSEMINLSRDIYGNSGGEKGILSVNSAATGPKDFEATYGEWINKRFKSYFKSKSAVMPLFKGMTYTGKQSETDTKASADFISLMDSAITRACNAYKVPPSLIRGEVAGTSDALDLMLTSCIDPLANASAMEFTAQEFTPAEIVSGSCIKAFTNNLKHTDIFSAADKFDKLFADGVSFNTLMELLDMPTVKEKWADEHHITKNYESVNSATQEGGKENA